MIEVINLTKRYGDKKAVDNISFKAEDGEVLGFLGPNGAGKSTTMNILTGYISCTDGKALIDGVDILEDPIKAKKQIGYLPELPPLYMDMTVKEYLYFVYDLKKCKLPKVSHLKDICGLVKIDHVYNRIIKNLSKGVKVDVLEGVVTVSLALNLKYDYSIMEVTKKVQEKVKNAVENMTGLEVADVNIKVAGVEMEKQN
mgnify:FL=1